MGPRTFRRLLHRELIVVLSLRDSQDFVNAVVGALASSPSLGITFQVPLRELGLCAAPHEGTVDQLVELEVNGRTAEELLVSCRAHARTVPLHYTKLLPHASFDDLLLIAHRVQSHMSMKTATMKAQRQEPTHNQALITLGEIATAATKLKKAGPAGPSPPSTP